MKSYADTSLDLEKSVAEQIQIIRRVIALDRQFPLFITFIDFKKAFDIRLKNDHVCNTSSLWYPRQKAHTKLRKSEITTYRIQQNSI